MIVILADASASMPISQMMLALACVARAVPGARIFVFADSVAEANNLRDCGSIPAVGTSTEMSLGLATIALLNPSLTIILSDGGVADDRRACFDIVDSMTGAISCLWLGARHMKKDGCAFLAELARRGGGEFKTCGRSAADLIARETLRFIRAHRVHHHRGEVRDIHHDHASDAIDRAPITATIRRGQ